MPAQISDIAKAFLLNQSFMECIFDCNSERLRYWREQMAKSPELKEGILEAEYVLLHIEDMESNFTSEELENLKSRIADTLNDQ